MKRIYLGLSILAALLALSVLFTILMNNIHTPMVQALHKAAEAATDGDWNAAGKLLAGAKGRWQRHRCFIAASADHSPMDDMESLFCELDVYLQQRDLTHFAATCRHLACLAEGMGENHALTWWNLL